MSNNYQIYLISDSTGETLDRIFTAIKAQFTNISYKIHTYSFTRTENQIDKILFEAEKNPNSIILYSIVDSSLAKYLAKISDNKEIPCFGVLGDLILSFSKLLNQKASNEPSGQHVLNEEYYKLKNKIDKIVAQMMGDTKINLSSTEDLSKVIYSRKVQDKKQWAELFTKKLC